MYVDFFFQAEDGIRDFHVTGVQTCALPISVQRQDRQPARLRQLGQRGLRAPDLGRARKKNQDVAVWFFARSEERRVGKECRSRWSPYDYIQKGSTSRI